MQRTSSKKGYVEERIESCRKIEQELAIPLFDEWYKDIGLLSCHKDSTSKIYFSSEGLSLYNKFHQFRFHRHKDKILKFWFVNSGIDFYEYEIEGFIEQYEHDLKLAYYMDLLLSIMTLGLHRVIIPRWIKWRDRRNEKELEELKMRIANWKLVIK